MPLPGSHVVHPSWSAHHQPTAEDTRTARVSVREPGGTQGAIDNDLGYAPTTPHPAYWSGAASIQALSPQDAEALAAEQEVSTVTYLVSVALDAAGGDPDFARGHLVHVDTAGPHGDPTLTGRDLTVQSVSRGSLTFERDLVCTDRV